MVSPENQDNSTLLGVQARHTDRLDEGNPTGKAATGLVLTLFAKVSTFVFT